MIRIIFAGAMISALPLQTAAADVVRRTVFPETLLGMWGRTAEDCTAKDKSNILIETAKYGDANGSCAVRWIVETPAPRGTNYAVHALCTSSSLPPKTQIVNIVIKPQSKDEAVMGRSFAGLKPYQRCPAQ
jgi:hypothetical protein